MTYPDDNIPDDVADIDAAPDAPPMPPVDIDEMRDSLRYDMRHATPPPPTRHPAP